MSVRKDVSDEISLLDLHDGIIRLENIITAHAGKEEGQIEHVLKELIDNKNQIERVQANNEKQLKLCHAEVKAMLDTNHYTKDQSREQITKAVQASEKRLVNKITAFLAGAGFIGVLIGIGSKYGSLILAVLSGKTSGQ